VVGRYAFVNLALAGKVALLAICTALPAACGSAPTPAKTAGSSYVAWLPLAPTHEFVPAPPATPPALPAGTPECKASQLEGESLGEGAATGNVNMPLQLRNRGGSACYVHGFPDVTVLDASGHVLARGIGADGRGTFFEDGPDVPILLPPGTPDLPAPKLPIDSTNLKGQAFMNFSWYDCPPLPQASHIALDLPDGGGRLIIPFALQAYYSAACGNGQAQGPAVFRGPFSATGVPWPPAADTIPVTVDISAPASVSRGATLVYFVTIRNDGSRDYRLQPCPDYFEFLMGVKNGPTYQLNCPPAGLIAPGRSVKFEMRLAIPSGEPTGSSYINWSLQDRRIDPGAAQAPILITA
jgi:hypothetical protein